MSTIWTGNNLENESITLLANQYWGRFSIVQGGPIVTTHTQPFHNSRNWYQNRLENIDIKLRFPETFVKFHF